MKKQIKYGSQIIEFELRYSDRKTLGITVNPDLSVLVKAPIGASKEKIFEKVEVEAEFPGGLPAWRRYLERNLNAQVPSDAGAPTGSFTVVVKFIVDKSGSISDVKALTNHGFGMEEEAVRAIKRGPKWTPAIQNGRNVNAYRQQPITFVVAEQ